MDLYFGQTQDPYNVTISLDGLNSTALVPSSTAPSCGILAFSQAELTLSQHTLTVSYEATPPSEIGGISFALLT